MSYPQLPGYFITRQLGEGSCGRVFLATSTFTSRDYCIKEVQFLSDDQRDRWETEFLPKSLDLSYLCTVRDTITFNNHYYIVMHLYSNSLTQMIYHQPQRTHLIKGTPLHSDQAWNIFRKLVEAVHSLHQEQLCHMNIKPENIFLDNELNAVLGDFGHSRAFMSVNLFTSAASQAYRAPEMSRNLSPEYDKEVDYFALGVVFYEMLVGELPCNPNSSNCSISLSALNKVADVEARKIIQQLTVPNPQLRASFFQLLHLNVRQKESFKEATPSIILASPYSPTIHNKVQVPEFISDSSDGEGFLAPSAVSLPRSSLRTELDAMLSDSSDDEMLPTTPPPTRQRKRQKGRNNGGNKKTKTFDVTLFLHPLQNLPKQTISEAAENLVEDEVMMLVEEVVSQELFSIKFTSQSSSTIGKLKELAQRISIQLPGTFIQCHVFLRRTDLVVLLPQQSFEEVKAVLLSHTTACHVLLRSTYIMESNRHSVFEISVLSRRTNCHEANNLTTKCLPFVVTYSLNSKFHYVFQVGISPRADSKQARKVLDERFNLKKRNYILVVFNAELLLFTSSSNCPLAVGNTFTITNSQQETNHVVSQLSRYNSPVLSARNHNSDSSRSNKKPRTSNKSPSKPKNSSAPKTLKPNPPKKTPSNSPTIKLFWKPEGICSIKYLRGLANTLTANSASSVVVHNIAAGFFRVIFRECQPTLVDRLNEMAQRGRYISDQVFIKVFRTLPGFTVMFAPKEFEEVRNQLKPLLEGSEIIKIRSIDLGNQFGYLHNLIVNSDVDSAAELLHRVSGTSLSFVVSRYIDGKHICIYELGVLPFVNLVDVATVLDSECDLVSMNSVLYPFNRRLLLISARHNSNSKPPLPSKIKFNITTEVGSAKNEVFYIRNYSASSPIPLLLPGEEPHINLAQHYECLLKLDPSQHFKTLLTKVSSCQSTLGRLSYISLIYALIQAHTIASVREGFYKRLLSGEEENIKVGLNLHQLENTCYSFNDLYDLNYSSTLPLSCRSVDVLQDDSLNCALNLDPTTNRVGVLNMANEEHPGGGYLTGASAQEESLFRRTTLGAALDPEQYGGQVVSGQRVAYPWKTAKIDVVVTENVEIFKTTEATGCQLLEKPQRVTIISTAAPQEPEISEVENFGEDYAHFDDLQLLYKRWTCVFLAAIKHGITHLVICPLGCGAFRNPIPGAMTVLSFVLSIFHKFFDSITLSASEDLYSSCASLLSVQSINESRQLKLPCRYLLSECPYINDSIHRDQFVHPTHCPNGNSCLMKNSLTHASLLKHPEKCRKFSNCELHGKDSVHDSLHDHADPCQMGVYCTDYSDHHRRSLFHPPLCPQGVGCSNRTSCLYSHERVQCPNPNCVDLTSDHLNSFNHSPLADDPFVNIESRCMERFVCRHGRSCNNNEPEHTERFIHIVRPECLGCASSDEVHLSTYHHVGVQDLRPSCPNGAACKNLLNLNHVYEFSHPSSKAFDIVGNLTPPSRGSEDQIDFSLNVDRLAGFCIPPNQQTPLNITSIAHFILGLKPVHRINVEPFLSCLVHGNFYSLEYMKTQLSQPESVFSIAHGHFKLHRYSNRAAVADYVALAAKNKFLDMRNFASDYGAQQEAKRLLMMNDTADLDELADSIAEAANELNNLATKEKSRQEDWNWLPQGQRARHR
ncbi:hypothetical protein P9112_013103 [Eukaryota sp. TZLM1-RC]